MTSQDMADTAWELGTGLNALSQQSEEPLRWVPCEKCGGMGYYHLRTGERMCPGQGGPYEPVLVEKTCGCEDGFVQVDEGDTRWPGGALDHPYDDG